MNPNDQAAVIKLLEWYEKGAVPEKPGERNPVALLCETVQRLRERNREYDWKSFNEISPPDGEAVVLLHPDGGLELAEYGSHVLIEDGTLWMQLTAIPDGHPSKV